MSTRHERRKRAKLACKARNEQHATNLFAGYVAETVKRNKAQPRKRNYYAGIISSVYEGNMSPRASGFGVVR